MTEKINKAASLMGKKGGTNSRKYMSKEKARELSMKANMAKKAKKAAKNKGKTK